MQQLEPSAGKGVGKLIRVFMESLGNFAIGRILAERYISRCHHRWDADRCIFQRPVPNLTLLD